MVMKSLFMLTVWLIGFFTAQATHERAGEVTYKHIEGLTYVITITTYTFAPSPADRCELEIEWGDGETTILPRTNGPPGNTLSGQFCEHTGELLTTDMRKNIYEGTHTFPAPGTYTISMEDPNRNAGILNIPNSVYVPFYVESQLVINPFLGPNNSPDLLIPPIDQACVEELFVHNPGAFDPDGDSLSFEFVDCKGSDGQPIPGYTLPPASTEFSLDSITGDLFWDAPTMQGEYNVAFRVVEWRDGNMIGSVMRDMQIQVSSCDNNAPELTTITDTCVRVGDTLRFDVTAFDPDTNRVELTAAGGPLVLEDNPAQFEQPIDSIGQVTSTFTWAPGCSIVRNRPYQVFFKAKDQENMVNLIDLHTTTIRVIGPPPENLVAVTEANSIQLSWDQSDCPNVRKYRIYRKNDVSGFEPGYCQKGIPPAEGFQMVKVIEVPDVISFIDDNNGNGLVRGIQYCYRITGVFPDGAESYASEEVCAHLDRDLPIITNASVRNTHPQNGSVYVAWSKPDELNYEQTPGPFQYRLLRAPDDDPGNFTRIATLDGINDTIYIDTNLNTRDKSYYYLVDFYNNTPGNLFFIGASEVARSTWLEIASGDNELNLSWTNEVPWVNESFVIYRKDPGSTTFDSVGIADELVYKDNGLMNRQEYCYTVKTVGNYTDSAINRTLTNNSQEKCGIPLDNEPPCPPELTVTTNCEFVENVLSWTNPNNYCADDVMKYHIFYRSPEDSDIIVHLDSTLSATETTYTHGNLEAISGCYYVIALDSVNNASDPSNTVCVSIDSCSVYRLPNAFTPNGDQYNDYLRPFPYTSVDRIDLQIFNRWGRVVFKTNDPDINWDGKNQNTNNDVSAGTYFYICDVYEITLQGRRKRTLQGSVTIIR